MDGIRTLPYGLESRPQFIHDEPIAPLIEPVTHEPVTVIRAPEGQEDQLRRIHQIFQALKSVPNMPKVIEGVAGSENFRLLVTDRIPNTTLFNLLKEGEGLYREELLQIMRQLLDLALRIHKLGYCNINFDPNNVAYDINNWSLAIIDPRSIVKIGEQQRDLGLETLRFMAPERLLGKKPSPLSDFWSLGILFFELITRTPFFPMTEMPKGLSISIQVKQLLRMMEDMGRYTFTDDEDPESVEGYSLLINSVDLSAWEEMKKGVLENLSVSYPEPYDWIAFLHESIRRKRFTPDEGKDTLEVISFALKNSEKRLDGMDKFSSAFPSVFEISIRNNGFSGIIEVYSGNNEMVYGIDTSELSLQGTMYLPPKVSRNEQITIRICSGEIDKRRTFSNFQSLEGLSFNSHPDVHGIKIKEKSMKLAFPENLAHQEAMMVLQRHFMSLMQGSDESEPDAKKQRTE